MKTLRMSVLPLLFMALMATSSADVTNLTPWKGSTITISGTSTLHEWTMAGSQIDGHVELATEVGKNATMEGWRQAGAPVVVVTIPVASLKSEHTKMDKLAYEAMKAKQFPAIRYELAKAALVRPGAQSFVLGSHGKLTIAGITREVDMVVTATRGADGRLTASGDLPIKMSDYGIKPPTAMLGTIKTGDAVKVSFRWVLEAR